MEMTFLSIRGKKIYTYMSCGTLKKNKKLKACYVGLELGTAFYKESQGRSQSVTFVKRPEGIKQCGHPVEEAK